MRKNKKEVSIEKEYSPKFEIVMRVRDLLGNPTGGSKSYASNKAEDIDEFWQRNCFRDKKSNEKSDTGKSRSRKSGKKENN